MLVLSRKKNEKIVINGNITIVVADIRGDKVRLGIEAPDDIPVHREEVQKAIDRKKAEDAAAKDTEKGPAPEAVASPAEDRQQVADPTAAAETTNTD